jgi:two-component system, chemotaxis family, sensor kinase CheA
MDEVIREFLVESQESLNQVEQDLMALEEDPGATERLSAIFRVVHSIKGSVGFLGFQKLGAVAHAGESLMSQLREGALRFKPAIADGLLALLDAMREMLAQIEATSRDGDRNYSELIDRLRMLQESGAASERRSQSEASSPADLPTDPDITISVSREAGMPAPVGTMPFLPPEASSQRSGITREAPMVESSPLFPEPPFPELEALEPEPRDSISGSFPSPTGVAPPAEASLTLPKTAPPPSVADSSIRVDVSLLDRLMALVGELVLSRNQMLQHTSRLNDPAFLTTSQRLNSITTELQEGMMKTRMQPIGSVWNKHPRMVRDLAQSCGKRVKVVLEGEDTELDKTVIEAIKDPLTHLVRNAVDHGIEAPELRAERGKPLEGSVSLRAFHEGGQVGIEITDDGAGIDLERVKQIALDRGLITREQTARMSDREVLNLIFLPGFSTAAQVTLVSGRGVGMDVVKTSIEKIGGSIDVQSRVGEGTHIKIKIPLTLAIIKALLISSAGNRFAIPQVNLLELVRLESETAHRGIEWVQGASVFRYRGRLLPLVDLNAVLAGAEESSHPLGRDGNPVHIVVLQSDTHPFGLLVDRVNDSQEIVVRPLAKQLRSIACFEGATILGDGKLALILDVAGLGRLAGVIGTARVPALSEAAGPPLVPAAEHRPMLLLEGSQKKRLAIPLEHVARLETVLRSAIARLGPASVVPYRGQILPLIDVGVALSAEKGQRAQNLSADHPESETVRVVVCSEQGRRVGLVCDGILDIVDEPIQAKGEAMREGVLYTAVMKDHVTEVLDVAGLVRAGVAALPRSTQLPQEEA